MLVSRRKRYLSGSDWVINTLDHLMKLSTSSGNMFQMVLLLDSALDPELLRASIVRFTRKFPVLQGKVARDFKLTPYWRIPAACSRDIALQVTQLPDSADDGSLIALLQQNANHRFDDDNEHIRFHLVNSSRLSALAITFDHRLFDARGAETFLHLLQQDMQGLDGLDGLDDTPFTSSMELTRWREKFLAGKTVNRRIIALSRFVPRIFSSRTGVENGYTFRLLSFTADQTAAILDQAYREAGYLMESPYFLSVITQAIHELFTSRTDPGNCYLVPVSTDLRTGQDTFNNLFFNHISFLFYQIPIECCHERQEIIALLKQQMYDQVKSGFHRDFATANLLTRIVPLRFLGRMTGMPMNGRIATFAYSHLGRNIFNAPSFMGASIHNLFHMPRVPLPPGVGFFTTMYQNRLNFVISCLEGLLTEDELTILTEGITRGLGVNNSLSSCHQSGH